MTNGDEVHASPPFFLWVCSWLCALLEYSQNTDSDEDADQRPEFGPDMFFVKEPCPQGEGDHHRESSQDAEDADLGVALPTPLPGTSAKSRACELL